jgi:hypothetical protein
MMPKAQPATDTAGGQKATIRAIGTAIPARVPDASAYAAPVPAARPAATSGWPAAGLDPVAAPTASAPESTIARSAIPVPGIAAARSPAVPAPVTGPAVATAQVSTAAPVSTAAAGTSVSRSAAHASSSTWQANLARLEGLAEVLSHHGLRARLMTPPGRVPSLHVVNPSAAALAEDVYAGRGQDGLWWFWWSWAERIAVGEDLEGAASLIEHVLAAS